MGNLILPLMLLLMLGFMLFSVRNQKKRAAAMSEMQNSLEPGTRVQLIAGLFGTVADVSEGDSVKIEIAPGVITEWNRQAIREIISPDVDDAPLGADAPDIESIDDSEADADRPSLNPNDDEK
ncbi:preprotein translocase subunit YajC [Gordonia shandongensis]|uniref:preprotein translocase subunit YajC n=1 Tax=Gordonia shandongensis TaxID=376351 RepID=UPI0003F6B30C|nr:preprotein translocase subunit YajC [Gordonia shandongensis]